MEYVIVVIVVLGLIIFKKYFKPKSKNIGGGTTSNWQ